MIRPKSIAQTWEMDSATYVIGNARPLSLSCSSHKHKQNYVQTTEKLSSIQSSCYSFIWRDIVPIHEIQLCKIGRVSDMF